MTVGKTALDLCDWPHEPRRSLCAVRVNEVHINLYGGRAVSDWWALYRCGNQARICIEKDTIAGAELHIHCEDREHADWLRGFLIENDVHKTALKVIKTNCREAVA